MKRRKLIYRVYYLAYIFVTKEQKLLTMNKSKYSVSDKKIHINIS